MPRLDLSAVIDGRVVANKIRPDIDDQVLAVDVLDRWAAVFRFSVSTGGEFFADTEIAARWRDGRWESTGGGGTRGGGWDVPWTRPGDGWVNGHLLSLALCGMDAELDDETEREVVAVCGFVSAATEAILVTNDGANRTITPAPTGAFVAIGFGAGFGFVELTPFADGVALSAAHLFPEP